MQYFHEYWSDFAQRCSVNRIPIRVEHDSCGQGSDGSDTWCQSCVLGARAVMAGILGERAVIGCILCIRAVMGGIIGCKGCDGLYT